ncbi:MAG: conjugal transfer protein TraO [Tannerella sp.]|jgi:hypothetical protein|nr:conjugal transfer protein TraO [Tannerella sp.]
MNVKKIVCFVFVCYLLAGATTNTLAQKPIWHDGGVNHTKGISNFGISYGRSLRSNLFIGSYGRYMTNKWIFNVNAMYENGQYELTHLDGYYVSSGFDRTLFKVKDFMYFNTGLAAYIGGENLSAPELGETKNSFVFGAAGNVNVELFIFTQFLVQVKAEKYYSPTSKLGHFFDVYSVGLRYCFY